MGTSKHGHITVVVACCLLGPGLIGFLFTALPVPSQNPPRKPLERYYADCIDRILASCHCKAERCASRSPRLRAQAEKAALKAAFLKTHREALIAEMMGSDIGRKDYKVKRFLNQRFSEMAARQAL